VKGVFPLTVAHGQPTDALLINLCGKEDERVQRWWFLSEVIECGFDVSWLGWWKTWAMVHDLELRGLGERKGWRFVNRDHIDRPRRPWNRMIAWGLFIPGWEPDTFTIPGLLFLFSLPLSSALMEHGDSSRQS
jgi:hypothetical protein